MSHSNSEPVLYPNTQAVYDLFLACQNAQELSHAAVRHFEADPKDPPVLSHASLQALKGLIIDGFIKEPSIGQQVTQYRQYYQQKEELHAQLKALGARKKTLSLQYRNAEQESSKGGLFRGKARQEQYNKAERLKMQLRQLQDNLDQIQAKLDQGEYILRNIAQEIQSQPTLKDAYWLSANQLVLEWTPSGHFLFDYLSEIDSRFFHAPLSQVLLYGHYWTNEQGQSVPSN